MKTASLDVLVATGMLLLGSYLIYQSWIYGISGEGATGSGFFPAIAGAIIFICSIGILFDHSSRAMFDGDAITLEQMKPIVGIIAATAVFIFLTGYLGMIPLMPLYVPAVAYSIQRPSTARGHVLIATISCVATFLFYLLFDVALEIPLPWGIWE